MDLEVEHVRVGLRKLNRIFISAEFLEIHVTQAHTCSSWVNVVGDNVGNKLVFLALNVSWHLEFSNLTSVLDSP